MLKTIKTDLKRIVALVLTVAMVIPMNTVVKAGGVGPYPRWDGDDSNYTHLTAHGSAYYEENGTTPKGSANTDTFGYYLNKIKGFRVRKFIHSYNEAEEHDSTWFDYSQILANCFKYELDEEDLSPKTGTPLTRFEVNSSEKEQYDRYEYVKNWTELRLLENVTDLTITGVENIEKIAFPSNIEKLTIKNCKFADAYYDSDSTTPTAFNLSSYTNLKELVITGTTMPKDFKYIGGLDSLKNLEKIQIDGSDITSIQLSTANDIASPGLIISANNCKKLTEVNTGNYMLINGYNEGGTQYAPSFRECIELGSLTVNGIADKTSQEFNINGCITLSSITMNYKFTDAKNRLKITATNVNTNDKSGGGNGNL